MTKIYQQIDFNEDSKNELAITTGSFQWEDSKKDTRVIFIPNKNGRFKITWVPSVELQNIRYIKNGINYPGNEHLGAFGCDPYDISGTVDGRGSKGSLHGLTKFSMENVPPNHFFLEYIARPKQLKYFLKMFLWLVCFTVCQY